MFSVCNMLSNSKVTCNSAVPMHTEDKIDDDNADNGLVKRVQTKGCV